MFLFLGSLTQESVFGALSFAGREVLYSHINHETHVWILREIVKLFLAITLKSHIFRASFH